MALDSAKPTKSQRYHQSSASAWLKDQRLTDSLLSNVRWWCHINGCEMIGSNHYAPFQIFRVFKI